MVGFLRIILQHGKEAHMRWLSLLVVFGGALLSVSNGLAEEKPSPVEGWTGIFPELTSYARTFEAPVVEKEKDKPVRYHQTAKYLWTGGALKSLTVRLARDPEFKKTHSADAFKKLDPAPKEVKVGKKDAWLSEGEKTCKLVILLAEDKALILEGKDMLGKEELLTLAVKFDLARAEEALDKPPQTK
jgi:hypothetical protein